MGNTLFTSVCRREEIVDFEDISDATFDFISVAVDPATTKTRKSLSPRCSTFDPVPKIVAVVPMALDDNAPTRPTTPVPEEPLSFNDRLNMLTWDPETTPLPTPFKPHEMYVFDEYSQRPNTTTSPSTKTLKHSRGWITRAIDKYQESKTRRREATQRRKRARPAPATVTKTTKNRTTRDLPYQLPLMTSARNLLEEDDEDERFVWDYDVELLTKTWNNDQDLLKTKYDQEVLSDTESDDSGSDATTLCGFYSRHSIDDDDASSRLSLDDDEDDDDDSDCEFSDWTRSSSTSSCYFSAAEDDSPTNDDAAFFASSASLCKTVSEYLCECDDCPTYVAIEREVTNSNCWMNEAERRSLCRILQAHATYQPSTPFCKDMIASAEECLLVFQGDEDAAFNAFLMIAQSKW